MGFGAFVQGLSWAAGLPPAKSGPIARYTATAGVCGLIRSDEMKSGKVTDL